jgi:hypothetical protein
MGEPVEFGVAPVQREDGGAETTHIVYAFQQLDRGELAADHQQGLAAASRPEPVEPDG